MSGDFLCTFSLLVNCSCPYLPGRRIIRSGFLFFQIAISLEAAQTWAASTQGPPSTYISQTKKIKEKSHTPGFSNTFCGLSRGVGKKGKCFHLHSRPHLPSRIFRGRGRHTFSHHRADIRGLPARISLEYFWKFLPALFARKISFGLVY